jgi:hypothetical protein
VKTAQKHTTDPSTRIPNILLQTEQFWELNRCPEHISICLATEPYPMIVVKNNTQSNHYTVLSKH